jgi:hypothetical protein
MPVGVDVWCSADGRTVGPVHVGCCQPIGVFHNVLHCMVRRAVFADTGHSHASQTVSQQGVVEALASGYTCKFCPICVHLFPNAVAAGKTGRGWANRS